MIRVRVRNKASEGNSERGKYTYKEIQAQEAMAYLKQYVWHKKQDRGMATDEAGQIARARC